MYIRVTPPERGREPMSSKLSFPFNCSVRKKKLMKKKRSYDVGEGIEAVQWRYMLLVQQSEERKSTNKEGNVKDISDNYSTVIGHANTRYITNL